MKKNLSILDIENKVTAAGKPYARVSTEDGWMACFNVKAVEELKKLINKNASVEVIQKGEYFNIDKCYGEAEMSNGPVNAPVEKVPQEMKVPNGQAAMYVSYAKDIFVKMLEVQKGQDIDAIKDMDIAISLVKQAQEAFN